MPEDEAINNNGDAEAQPLAFEYLFFPDCQLRTAFPEQSCLRISFDHEEHERLLHFEGTLKMTEKLNDVLKQQNLSIYLLRQKPELKHKPNTSVELVDENEPGHDSDEENSPASPSTILVCLGELDFTCAEEIGLCLQHCIL